MLKLSIILPRQNLLTLDIPISKICSKPTFISENWSKIKFARPEKIHWPIKIKSENENLKKNWNQLQILMKVAEKLEAIN